MCTIQTAWRTACLTIAGPRGAVTGIMRIDTHQHYWRYDAADYAWIDDRMPGLKRDRLPGDVRPAMTRAGFDAAIAVQARQTPDETASLLALADSHPFIAGVVGWVDLMADDVEARLAAHAAHPKLVGMRHIVQDEPDDRFLLRPDFCRGVARLADFGLTYDILIYPRHLPLVVDFVGRFPGQRFVIDHLAKPEIAHGRLDRWARDLEAVAACPDVHAKLSGLVTEASWEHWTPADLALYLDVALDLFGPDRLMVGSDWPVCTLAAGYERTMSVFTTYLAGRPERARQAILGGNASRFYRCGGEA
jgi:L-fuconolactonase